MRTLISALHFLAYQIVQQVLSWITLFTQGTGDSQKELYTECSACVCVCVCKHVLCIPTHTERGKGN
jgi:hypothetical protein